MAKPPNYTVGAQRSSRVSYVCYKKNIYILPISCKKCNTIISSDNYQLYICSVTAAAAIFLSINGVATFKAMHFLFKDTLHTCKNLIPMVVTRAMAIFIMLQKNAFGQKKLNFMHGFKSAILAIFQFWQNGTFEPVHEIENNFWPKDFPF